MSYCRFENTANDLQDCYENMDNDSLSESEKKARTKIIIICRELLENYGDEINNEKNQR